jgi:spermidine synthase
MPTAAAPQQHVKPYVQVGERTQALHFSIHEIQSRMQVADPHALDLDYTRTMMAFLAFHPAPRQLTMIGLGGGSLAKFCHRHLPQTQLRVVEINPHVVALRDTFHVPPDDERFTVVLGDGARVVRDCAAACDVLLVDGYDSEGLPLRLSSQRFYDDCRAALAPGGVMVANLHSGHRRFGVFVDRIRRSFDDSVLVVETRDRANGIVFAFRDRPAGDLQRGPLRLPAGLDRAAQRQLRPGLAAVAGALSAQLRQATSHLAPGTLVRPGRPA